jgi:hypothetical protein
MQIVKLLEERRPYTILPMEDHHVLLEREALVVMAVLEALEVMAVRVLQEDGFQVYQVYLVLLHVLMVLLHVLMVLLISVDPQVHLNYHLVDHRSIQAFQTQELIHLGVQATQVMYSPVLQMMIGGEIWV